MYVLVTLPKHHSTETWDSRTSRCVFTTRLRTRISLPLLAIAQLSHVITLSGGVFVRLIFVAITRSPPSSHEAGISDTFVVKTDN